MNHDIYPDPSCACGALLDEGRKLCRKCRARDRWLRKQAAKRKGGRRRGETRRPPRAPRGLAAAGVIWS
ncbi:hypothetical protein ACQEVF_24915 [Nonomuraea polychroma]|uniref:hypothetical protein n=1 Tax=Nonomuraea polychroma TaxID=46176 RepID=UPI003D91CD74